MYSRATWRALCSWIVKSTIFYGTKSFMGYRFTMSRHCILPSTKWRQSSSSQMTAIGPVLLISFRLLLGLPSYIFRLKFCVFSHVPYSSMPSLSLSLSLFVFITVTAPNIWWMVQISEVFVMWCCTYCYNWFRFSFSGFFSSSPLCQKLSVFFP